MDIDGTTVIDCPNRKFIPNFLDDHGINVIEAIIVSHADDDHVSGATFLIESGNVDIKKVIVNPDAEKKSDTWLAFCAAVDKAVNEKRIILDKNLYAGRKIINYGEVDLEVLSPTVGMSLRGAGSNDLNGNALDSNSMSAVIKLIHKSKPVALITGDMNRVSYNNIINRKVSLEALVLVYPHHGGHTHETSITQDEDEKMFAKELCEQVKPVLIAFSIGRGQHGTPRRTIIEGIKQGSPNAHIICTQLSTNCSTILPLPPTYLYLPSQGVPKNTCCGGSIIIELNGLDSIYSPNEEHKNFVLNILKALCRG